MAGDLLLRDFIEGRRSITEHFDRALSARERQVWKLVAAGWSNKLIADSLGLRVPTVATFLRRARRKLGGEAAPPRFPCGDRSSRDRTSRMWLEESRLTPAEREVALLAGAGLSNHAIARQRHSSVHTVVKQLSAAYVKLGRNGRRELRAALRSSPSKQPRHRPARNNLLNEPFSGYRPELPRLPVAVPGAEGRQPPRVLDARR